MTRALFVSNGHGEEAIAARIARELLQLAPVQCDHLALVGQFGHPSVMRDVGPRARMPSGGLIAMGNVRNIVRDLRAGLVGHTLAQVRFLRAARDYDVTVAVGDIYALIMALQTRTPVVYVGTAKSVYVAPYGPMERKVLRRARAIFVRDAQTARSLRARGVAADAPGNVIVDLYGDGHDDRFEQAAGDFAPLLGLFPGSRPAGAYEDARFLCAIVRDLAGSLPHVGGVLSIAPGLDVARFAQTLAADGWRVVERADPAMPLVVADGERERIRAWCAGIGPILERATIVLGQAGTANEAAAGAGVPVMAFEIPGTKKSAWYRTRQAALLGEALRVAPGTPERASSEVRALLADAPARVRMGSVGRERMGAPGGARAIARRIVEIAEW
ncbi:MAG TPA: lipid-A-disaccharide synthase-related protein [Candidatus Baltobacteraceae bacterium]|jgi:uncharacterized protein (TIGR03492 family)